MKSVSEFETKEDVHNTFPLHLDNNNTSIRKHYSYAYVMSTVFDV
jgi:hypothetical protein